MIVATRKDVEERVEQMENNLEEETKKWVGKINDAIPKVKAAGREVRDQLNDPRIADASKLEDIDGVIDFLHMQQEEVNSLRTQSQKFME